MTQFNPSVFDVLDLGGARAIALTPEGGQSPRDRDKIETPYLTKMIEHKLEPKPNWWVLDFGCGYGRLSRAVIRRCQCNVIGVDTSPSMRKLAQTYVGSPKFVVRSPEWKWDDVHCEAAIAIWVLQHVFDLPATVKFVYDRLEHGRKFFVVNNVFRAVPTDKGWTDDGQSVHEEISKLFKPVQTDKLNPKLLAPGLSAVTYWGLYEKV